jgi:adenosylcobinamide-GDP ribazoletransferase
MRGVSPLHPLAAATAFLTRIPVGRVVDIDSRAIARAAALYPLVGAAVGAAGGAVVDVLAGPLPTWSAAVVGVGVAALLTGAMHLDALADTADALGGMTRERRLEIMRDHAVGAFGVIALVLVLLLEISLLAELGERDLALVSFAAAGACSRWAALPLAVLLPYARPHGEGHSFASDISPGSMLVGLTVAAAVSTLALGTDAAAMLGAAVGVALVLGVFYRRWLGGVTGDMLGAATALAQAACLAAAYAAA